MMYIFENGIVGWNKQGGWICNLLNFKNLKGVLTQLSQDVSKTSLRRLLYAMNVSMSPVFTGKDKTILMSNLQSFKVM